MFFKLLKSEYKKIKSTLIAFTLIFVLLSIFSIIGTKYITRIFSKNDQTIVNVGIVMNYTSDYSDQLYIFVSNMDSYKSICNFIQIEDEQTGITELEKGNINALVLVPDDILSDIMTGVNTPITVKYNNHGSLDSFVTECLFTSTSSFLGTAQSAIYSVIDISSEYTESGEEHEQVINDINMIFLEKVFSRDDIFEREPVNATGAYRLIDFYVVSLMFLIFFICTMLFTSFYKSYNKSTILLLKTKGINKIHILLSQILSSSSIFYFMYILLYTILGFLSLNLDLLNVKFSICGYIIGIPLVVIICTIAALICRLPINISTTALAIFIVFFALAYAGGLIVPKQFLPNILKNTCDYNPFNMMVRVVCYFYYR